MFRYKPRIVVHPQRKGALKTKGANRLLVLHTSEGAETGNAAENLGVYMGMPGDRVVPGSDPPRMYGSSYHGITDTDESVIPAVDDNQVAYAAGGANAFGVHLCIPGKAGQTEQQWLDADSTAHIQSAAWWLKQKSIEHAIPLVRLTVRQMQQGASGYCDHNDVRLAFGETDHTDVGPKFPWELLSVLLDDPQPKADPGMATLKGGAVRIYDSRNAQHNGQPIAGGSNVRVGVVAPPNVPGTNAPYGAAIVKIGSDGNAAAPGWFSTQPGTSVVDIKPGDIDSNLWHVPLTFENGGWGFTVWALADAHLIVDLVGWDIVI